MRDHARVERLKSLFGRLVGPVQDISTGSTVIAWRPSADPALLLGEEQLPGRLDSPLEDARDHAEDARQLKFHRHCGVEHMDDARKGLPQPRDTEGQPIAVPSFAARARAAGQLSDDLREAGFDSASSLGAAELVRNRDRDGRGHACTRRFVAARQDPGPPGATVSGRRCGTASSFEQILADSGLSAGELLVVGDNPESEIAAGNRLGIMTIRTLRPGASDSPGATGHVDSIAGLKPLLQAD